MQYKKVRCGSGTNFSSLKKPVITVRHLEFSFPPQTAGLFETLITAILFDWSGTIQGPFLRQDYFNCVKSQQSGLL
jgi:hypothetical protein